MLLAKRSMRADKAVKQGSRASRRRHQVKILSQRHGSLEDRITSCRSFPIPANLLIGSNPIASFKLNEYTAVYINNRSYWQILDSHASAWSVQEDRCLSSKMEACASLK